ncbi:hypothetical protein QTN25_010440 [Entamoeba marina]
MGNTELKPYLISYSNGIKFANVSDDTVSSENNSIGNDELALSSKLSVHKHLSSHSAHNSSSTDFVQNSKYGQSEKRAAYQVLLQRTKDILNGFISPIPNTPTYLLYKNFIKQTNNSTLQTNTGVLSTYTISVVMTYCIEPITLYKLIQVNKKYSIATTFVKTNPILPVTFNMNTNTTILSKLVLYTTVQILFPFINIFTVDILLLEHLQPTFLNCFKWLRIVGKASTMKCQQLLKGYETQIIDLSITTNFPLPIHSYPQLRRCKQNFKNYPHNLDLYFPSKTQHLDWFYITVGSYQKELANYLCNSSNIKDIIVVADSSDCNLMWRLSRLQKHLSVTICSYSWQPFLQNEIVVLPSNMSKYEVIITSERHDEEMMLKRFITKYLPKHLLLTSNHNKITVNLERIDLSNTFVETTGGISLKPPTNIKGMMLNEIPLRIDLFHIHTLQLVDCDFITNEVIMPNDLHELNLESCYGIPKGLSYIHTLILNNCNHFQQTLTDVNHVKELIISNTTFELTTFTLPTQLIYLKLENCSSMNSTLPFQCNHSLNELCLIHCNLNVIVNSSLHCLHIQNSKRFDWSQLNKLQSLSTLIVISLTINQLFIHNSLNEVHLLFVIITKPIVLQHHLEVMELNNSNVTFETTQSGTVLNMYIYSTQSYKDITLPNYTRIFHYHHSDNFK